MKSNEPNKARVGNFRSDDTRVHLIILDKNGKDDQDGRADFKDNPQAYAIAAAAQAGGKQVWMTYEKFTSQSPDGIGVFTGVKLGTDNWTT